MPALEPLQPTVRVSTTRPSFTAKLSCRVVSLGCMPNTRLRYLHRWRMRGRPHCYRAELQFGSVGAQWTAGQFYNPQSSSNNCWWSPIRQQELTLRHPDPPLLISIFPLKGIKRYAWAGTTSWDGISHLLFSKQEGSEGNLVVCSIIARRMSGFLLLSEAGTSVLEQHVKSEQLSQPLPGNPKCLLCVSTLSKGCTLHCYLPTLFCVFMSSCTSSVS